MSDLARRRVLRGILSGGAVTVGLPLLDCYLNGNGDAFADQTPLPVRFGTWFWGCGMTKSIFVPKQSGKNYELTEELAAFKNVKDDINVHTNLVCHTEGQGGGHYTGWVVFRTGAVPAGSNTPAAESLDTTIANRIGRTTRFKSLTATATGDVRNIISYENPTTPNAPEFSPIAFYSRLFGPDFQDPNAPTFAPSPRVMVRKSALSAVSEQIKALEKNVGSEDKARLEQYFAGLRHLEQQFQFQLTKPEPRPACVAVKKVEEEPVAGTDSRLVAARHNLMTDLMVMAVACDQTRVFNMTMSKSDSNSTKAGYEKPHHTCTHEEPVDEKLGYQPNASWFVKRSMENLAYFVEAFKKVKEGDGTLLDNVLIMANSDVSYARIHSADEMPAFTAGRAGGKVKTGMHIDHGAAQATSVGLTILKVMGVPIDTWGGKSNQTTKTVGEILA
jgi:hypothetical protein